MINSTSFSLAGTDTFRRASKMLFGMYGSNLQNPTKKMMEIYRPRTKGSIFIQPDQAGAEALVVSYLTPHGLFRDLFLNNIKSHTYVAAHIFANTWRVDWDFPDIDDILACDINLLRRNDRWAALAKIIKKCDIEYFVGKKSCHCIDGQTELLTKNGWIQASQYNQKDEIAIWSIKDRSITFEVPSVWNTFIYNGEMIQFSGKELNQFVTPEHRMVYYTNGTDKCKTAKELFDYQSLKIPCNGNYVGGDIQISDEEVQLIAAIQADASIDVSGKIIRFHLRRNRKVERLLSILDKLRIEYKSKISYIDDSYRITLYNAQHILSWLDEKKFCSKILDWNKRALEILVKEVTYWDGHQAINSSNAKYYYSSIKQNVEWVEIYARLCGFGTCHRQTRDGWTLSFNSRKQTYTEEHKKIQNFQGQIYCPSVSTGFFLIRRNGKISVTGNSLNYRMRPPTFREDVLKESEGKVVLSKIDSERIYDIYHNKLFTEISTKWWPEIEYQVRGSGYLFNLFGFPRYCQGPFIDADWRKLTAWVPQSTVGCITAIAFCTIQEFIEENGLAKWWHLCNDKHDSLLLECPEEDRDIAGRVCASAIEQDLESPRGEKFKMRSEVQWGYNWAKQSEKNPEGMRELSLTE